MSKQQKLQCFPRVMNFSPKLIAKDEPGYSYITNSFQGGRAHRRRELLCPRRQRAGLRGAGPRDLLLPGGARGADAAAAAVREALQPQPAREQAHLLRGVDHQREGSKINFF